MASRQATRQAERYGWFLVTLFLSSGTQRTCGHGRRSAFYHVVVDLLEPDAFGRPQVSRNRVAEHPHRVSAAWIGVSGRRRCKSIRPISTNTASDAGTHVAARCLNQSIIPTTQPFGIVPRCPKSGSHCDVARARSASDATRLAVASVAASSLNAACKRSFKVGEGLLAILQACKCKTTAGRSAFFNGSTVAQLFYRG